MFILKVFVLVCITYVAADGVDVEEARKILQVNKTAIDKPKTTTEAPTTPKPSPTTPKPTTTSAKPTPTIKPTPQPPSPTTTKTPSTTVAPVPVKPSAGLWSANFTATNKTCIILQVATQLNIEYKQGNKTNSVKVNVPKNATSEGNCVANANKENIKLTWDSNNIVFYFSKVNKTKFDLERIQVNINITIPGINATVFQLEHKQSEFVTPLLNSYKCMPERRVNLTSSVPVNATIFLAVSQLQFEAFKNATGQHFNTALDCEASNTPDAVPIAVGCALAALVIVVLAAYLIGRRRSQARGYLSM